jgi:hypothetical protein
MTADMSEPAGSATPIVRVSGVWVYMGDALALRDVSLCPPGGIH